MSKHSIRRGGRGRASRRATLSSSASASASLLWRDAADAAALRSASSISRARVPRRGSTILTRRPRTDDSQSPSSSASSSSTPTTTSSGISVPVA